MSDSTGNLYIVSAPSGAGKTSLLTVVLGEDEHLQASISYTTRSQRHGEIEGTHYHFIAVDEFHRMVSAGEFLEHAEVFGNFYGSSESGVREQLRQGQDVVLEIDWQGASQVRKLFPDAISVFILPPSVAELQQRLSHRGQDATAVIEHRMQQARDDMAHFVEFDYLIINDNFDQAVTEFRAIVCAERLRTGLQSNTNLTVLNDLLGVD